MCPVLFRLGAFEIHTYGVCVALGVLLSLLLMRERAGREGWQAEEIMDLVLWFTVACFIGARLFYVLDEWEYYLKHPMEIFAIWEGGLIFYGGGITGLIFLRQYAKWKKVPFLSLTDFLAPFVAFAHAFGRIGCFLNGCCYGRFSTAPWAVSFPSLPETVHPTQLYEAAFNFVLFPVLLFIRQRRRFEGECTFFYFLLYGTGRFFLEYFRGDNFPVWMGFTLPQVISLLFIGTGLTGFSWSLRKYAAGKDRS